MLYIHSIVWIDRFAPRLCNLSLNASLHDFFPHVLDTLHEQLLQVAPLIHLSLVLGAVILHALLLPFQQFLQLLDLVSVGRFESHHIVYDFLLHFFLRELRLECDVHELVKFQVFGRDHPWAITTGAKYT